MGLSFQSASIPTVTCVCVRKTTHNSLGSPPGRGMMGEMITNAHFWVAEKQHAEKCFLEYLSIS